MSPDSLFAEEVERIISVLRSDVPQVLVILAIPSHDKNEKELKNQEWWANEAADMFAELYGGATAFQALVGTFKYKDKILHDRPIMVESYAQKADVEDPSNLVELLRFAKRMGKETRQAAVAIVIGNIFFTITDFKVP